jgi:hypothetical protein
MTADGNDPDKQPESMNVGTTIPMAMARWIRFNHCGSLNANSWFRYEPWRSVRRSNKLVMAFPTHDPPLIQYIDDSAFRTVVKRWGDDDRRPTSANRPNASCI